MKWGKKTSPQEVVTEPVATTDQGALLHEAYMLVRHLQVCYRDASVDSELSMRLNGLLGHMFPPGTVERLLEALQRPFTQDVPRDVHRLMNEQVAPVQTPNGTREAFSSDGVTESR